MPFVNFQIVVDDYRALGIDLPSGAAEALDTWTALSEAAAAKPSDDLRAALADGSLSSDNAGQRLREAALTLALRGGMESLLRDLDSPAARRGMAAFADDADRVVAELAERFESSAATVVAGLEHFSPTEYADPGRLLVAKPGAAERYHPTRQAAAELDLIGRVLTSVQPLGVPVSRFVTLDDEATSETLSVATAAYNSGSPQRWVALFATPGLTAALNSQAEAAQVVAKSAELGQARAAETTERSVRRARRSEPWLVS